MFSACCNGQHFATAKVVCRKATGADGGQQIFLEYDFTDVMVESIQWSGSSAATIRRRNRSASRSRRFRSRTEVQDEAAGACSADGRRELGPDQGCDE